MTKKRWVFIVFCISVSIIGFLFVTTLAKSDQVLCQPTTNPWQVENFAIPNEYYGGYFPNVTIVQVCTISGHITSDQFFSQKIAQGFVFYLEPGNGGWIIGMTNENDETHVMNFSVPVALPTHGLTSLDIWGELFFMNKNSGEEISGSEESPVSRKEFSFLLSDEDYKAIRDYYICWRDGTDCPPDWKGQSDTLWSRGVFTITKLKVGDFTSKEQAWIESMDFEVKVYLPAE